MTKGIQASVQVSGVHILHVQDVVRALQSCGVLQGKDTQVSGDTETARDFTWLSHLNIKPQLAGQEAIRTLREAKWRPQAGAECRRNRVGVMGEGWGFFWTFFSRMSEGFQ